MAVLTRTLNILVLILALAATVFSIGLYRARRELRQRGDALAQTVNKAYGHISDREAELDWRRFRRDPEGYRRRLHRFVDDAAAIRDQRDEQLEMIATLETDLANEREALAETAGKLAAANDRIAALDARQRRYADVIVGVGKQVKARVNDASPAAVATIHRRIRDLNNEVAQVADLKRQEKLQAEHLKLQELDIERLERLVKTGESRIADLQRRLEEQDERPDPPDPVQLKRRRGKIVKVNYEYNYIIVDMGWDLLEKGTDLAIHRQKEYIGEARVSRTYKSYAVAEILPAANQGFVLAGDEALFLPDPLIPKVR